MGFTDSLKKSPPIDIDDFQKEVGLAQWQYDINMKLGGISLQAIQELNTAEQKMFSAAIGSFIPNIAVNLEQARLELDSAYKKTLGMGSNLFYSTEEGIPYSQHVMKKIKTALENHGLDTSQLQVS